MEESGDEYDVNTMRDMLNKHFAELKNDLRSTKSELKDDIKNSQLEVISQCKNYEETKHSDDKNKDQDEQYLGDLMNKARSVDDIVKYFAEFDYSDEENVLYCTLCTGKWELKHSNLKPPRLFRYNKLEDAFKGLKKISRNT